MHTTGAVATGPRTRAKRVAAPRGASAAKSRKVPAFPMREYPELDIDTLADYDYSLDEHAAVDDLRSRFGDDLT